MGKTNDAWAAIINKYNIIEEIDKNGYYKIDAATIKEYREPRLMSKFDSEDGLPEVFIKNEINILPLSYSSYILGRFKLFKKFPRRTVFKPIPVQLMDFETIKVTEITSESNAINVLILSKALDDFLNTEENYGTFNGRMGSGPFNYFVDTTTDRQYIESQSVQLEIDGGFENIESVVIMEAKNVVHDDFNIRQLYFPYRLWRSRVQKPIRLVFSVYNNLMYRLLEYKFNDENDFSSIELIKEAYYTLEDINISVKDIRDVINKTDAIYTDELNNPNTRVFPQANSVERYISLLEMIKATEEPMTADDIAEEMEFNKRQSDYYFNMGYYLETLGKQQVENKGVCVFLSKDGQAFLSLNFKGRILKLVEDLSRHSIWKALLLKMVDKENDEPYIETIDNIAKMLLDRNIILSETTAKRRASSVRSWLVWLSSVITSME